MEDTATYNPPTKRGRDDRVESPEAKRFRADLLLDILEDVDSVDRNPAATGDDLATVMKSFEEEIASLSPPPVEVAPEGEVTPPLAASTSSDSDDLCQPDLGYLLEASDDELGLPPTVPTSSDEGDGGDGDLEAAGDHDAYGFGQIWGFEDGMSSGYDALDFGGFGDDATGGENEGVVFDGGLFDYTDVGASGASDLSDFSWRPESLPAV